MNALVPVPETYTAAELAQRQADAPAVRALVAQMQRDLPGVPTDNRLLQSQHYKGVIYKAIDALATGAKGAELRVMRRTQQPVFQSKKSRRLAKLRKSMGQSPHQNADELVEAKTTDRFVKLFERPNPQDSIQNLLAMWFIQSNLTGSTALWARPSRLEFPCELYIFPTAVIYPVPWSPSYPVGAWRVQQYYTNGLYGILPGPMSGGGVTLDAREIHRDKKQHALWRWDGYAPLTACGVQLDVLESIDIARKAMSDNGVMPSGIMSLPGASDSELIRVQNELRNNHGGAPNVQQIMVTNAPDGAGFKPYSMTGRDLEFDKGWDQMVKFVLALFGVPPTVAGMDDSGSYSKLFASLKQFHTLKLLPDLQDIARFLTQHVVRPYDDDAVVQIDLPQIDDKSQVDAQLAKDAELGAITFNEYRGKRGMKPMPWGDVQMGKSAPPMAQPDAAGGMDADADPMDPEDEAGADEIGNAAVSLLTGEDADPGMVTKAGWDESKHKRGNAKNKGQFGPGGGGGAASSAKPGPVNRVGSKLAGAAESVAAGVSGAFRPVADFIDWFNQSGDPPFGEAASRFGWMLARMTGQSQRLAHLWDNHKPSGQAVAAKVQQKTQSLAANPAAVKAATTAPGWAARKAKQNAGTVAQKLGIAPEAAEAMLHATILTLTSGLKQSGAASATRRLGGYGPGKGVNVTVRRKNTTTAPGDVSRPKNPAATGALPGPAVVKSYLRRVLRELP